MSNPNIIGARETLGQITDKYDDLIGDEFVSLQREYGIDSVESLKTALKNIENSERLLQIGIVGRVKSGKSSLLNALLFDGKSVLPKAATPMTAALTVLSYGENLSAEVEFFSKQDFDAIKADHRKYENKLSELAEIELTELKKKQTFREKAEETFNKKSAKELHRKAERKALRKLKEKFIELGSAYDQFNRMKVSGVNPDTLDKEQHLEADSIETLSKLLLDYVGADSKYMPFTKSVHIKLPQDNLKDVQIVDTPGINDPVQSREDRTRELLKYCDVVFVVSPAGQFLSNEDIDLMDRITSKEGVNEIFVVSSQVDTQLFGNEKQKSKGDLQKTLASITSNLGSHLISTVSDLKTRNPEIGSTFDQLIEQSKDKVVHSAGICQTLKSAFDEKDTWDDGAKKVWENLTREYPDYFSDNDKTGSIANLDLLANISEIENIIAKVRVKKDEILNKRKEEFLSTKSGTLGKCKEELSTYIIEQLNKINNSNLEELKKEKVILENTRQNASVTLNEEYSDVVTELNINIKNELNKTLNSYFKETRKSVNNAEEEKTKTYEVSSSSWYNPFSWGSTETRTKSYTTVRSGAVRAALEDLTVDIENTISTQSQNIILQWKKSLNKQLLQTLRRHAKDDDLDPNLINSTIRKVINSVVYPEIEYGGSLPSSLNAKGTLERSNAEEFIDSARDYLTTLKRRVNNDIKSYLTSLIGALNKLDPAKDIFGNYKTKIEALETQMNNKEQTIERFNILYNELEEIKP